MRGEALVLHHILLRDARGEGVAGHIERVRWYRALYSALLALNLCALR